MPDTTHEHLTTLQRLLLTAAALACYGIWYVACNAVSMPAEHGFSTSLLSNPAYAIGLVAIGIPLLTALSSLLVGRIRFEAGLFAALIGLCWLPTHSGDLRNALLADGTGAVFARFAAETALLGAIIAFSYGLLGALLNTGWITPAVQAPQKDPDTLGDRLTVLAAQAAVVLVILIFVGQSPVKGQAIIGVCAAGILASMAIHQTYKVSGSIWYILGTMLACMIANLYCWYNPVGIAIGDIRGIFAGPARSLPLHYATLGVAGTIFGYWTSLVWIAGRKAQVAQA